MRKIPRIVIAGTQSGVGKTSIALALMAAFKKAGLRVQPFKVGPDYIDPSYHKVATGLPSHNLDSWLLSEENVQWLFQSKSESADLSIIEGVMGLYDGFGGKEDTASTAQIAKLLKAPVLLVLDARKIARSAAAMVLGYKSFDPELKICGVILNMVGSPKHFEMLKDAIEFYAGVPVLGAIFRDNKVQIPERHLGLITASENKNLQNCIDSLAALTKDDSKQRRSGIELERILKIANDVPALPEITDPLFQNCDSKPASNNIRIAIAQDRAFNFYYQANLDLLNELGAELLSFSPLKDRHLPDGCSALYFGGGFPEIYPKELEENEQLKVRIRQLIQDGFPVYAECGGLIYLSETIQTLEGHSYAMVGAVPGKICMTEKLQNFGYKEGQMMENNLLGSKGDAVRGHEFHYSQREVKERELTQASYELIDRKSGTRQLEGHAKETLLASYLHLHFLTNLSWAKNFVQAARNYEAIRMKKEVLATK